MKPYYQDDAVTIYHSDCLIALQSLADNSVDSIVTDPPYGLAFMGKKWDYDVPSVEVWAECLRVLKPGGHLLAFAGTRTQHRMACRIEDAGFEIRDMIAWVYGSGFPKSLDVGKAIDKAAGAEREVVGTETLANDIRGNSSNGKGISGPNKAAVPLIRNITAPATEAAKQWDGWGSALKPAMEMITMARKPLDGTIAGNVLKHGVGGINVDGCRVEGGKEYQDTERKNSHKTFPTDGIYGSGSDSQPGFKPALGRFPANLIHDGSDEVVGLFPETTSKGHTPNTRGRGGLGCNGHSGQEGVDEQWHDSGSAARFFYCAKSDATERRNSKHPTVKPIALMRYLVRLVTPIGATMLDPFMGSGTTIEAARLESCKSIGMEREAEYCSDATKRLSQGVLF